MTALGFTLLSTQPPLSSLYILPPLLHWFPLADKVTYISNMPCTSIPSSDPLTQTDEFGCPPLLIETTHSQSSSSSSNPSPTLSQCLLMKTPVSSNPHVCSPLAKGDPPHLQVQLAQASAQFHPAMAECLYLPPLSQNPTCFQEIVSRIDLPLEGYIDPHTTLPISIYQFLSAWTKFAPSEYYTYYFEEVVDMNTWMLQGELMHNIQLSVATLESVIKDAVILVGGEKQHFVIDVESQYQLKL
jgi:hypothetical protein